MLAHSGTQSKEIAQHTKDTVQVWRDCASLRIVLQSALQMVHQEAFQPDATAPIATGLESSICEILEMASKRISPYTSHSSEASWDRINSYNQLIMKYCLAECDIWHENTKVPGRKTLKALDQSISSQMEYVMNDPDERAVKRCRGITEEQYDDAPLYAALLKESVQKGASGDEYTAMRMASKLGKRTQNKQVDRRASKGRKIRYNQIDKLLNFMAPRPVPLSEGIPITNEELISAFVNSVFQ